MAFVIRHGTQTVGVAYSAIVQRPMVAQGLISQTLQPRLMPASVALANAQSRR
jgi:hypothetical protein